MADRKISALTTLTGAGFVGSTDYVQVLDMSAVDADKNKKMLGDEFRVAQFCGAMVKKAADQTAANYSAGANIAWDSESYDLGGWHDNVTNNSRLIVPASRGITKVCLAANIYIGGATFTSSSTLLFEILKNGSSSYDGATAQNPWPAGNATSAGTNLVSGPILATAGDYFELKLTTADTSITITATRSNFSIWAVG